jgi:hypothetical protein
VSRELPEKAQESQKATELVGSVASHLKSPRCAVCSFVLNLLAQVGILSISPALLKRLPLSTTGAAIAFPTECPTPFV